jgi:hypothetical protein
MKGRRGKEERSGIWLVGGQAQLWMSKASKSGLGLDLLVGVYFGLTGQLCGAHIHVPLGHVVLRAGVHHVPTCTLLCSTVPF